MRNIFFTLILLFYASQVKSQQVNGYVTDAETGEVLIGTHIYASQSKVYSVTNTFGFFSILLRQNDSLIVSFVGYEKKKIAFASIGSSPIQIKLKSSTNIMEVVVTAHRSIQETTEMGTISIPMRQLKTIPSLAGESDVMKTMQLMPGIKSFGEGQSSFMVRGGSPDQNMVILDNVPLYYINHLGGFVSVFNSDAINDFKLYKGSFPARYGGRLSSIINVNTKDGNISEKHSALSIGLITNMLLLEGPIIKDTLSYFFSIRRFMYDLISRPLTYFSNDKKQSGYTFYDVNAKVNYKLNLNNRLYLSFYSGRDKMLSKQKENDEEKSLMDNTSKWGNLTTSLRWNHIYGAKLFSNITLYNMQYKYNSDFEYTFEQNDNKLSTVSNFKSEINDFGLNADFEYYIHSNVNIRFGSNHIHHTYKPNNYHYSQPTFSQDYSNNISSVNNQKNFALENSIYAETDLSLSKYLFINIGYRVTSFSSKSSNYLSNEPRFVLNLNLPHIFSTKVSYARMSQYVHLVTYFGTSIPADLWMPSTETVSPQHSEIYSLGLYRELFSKNLELSIEGYYKELNDLIEFKPGYNIFSSAGDWTVAIEQNGTGESKGIELLIQRKSGSLSGWVSYTLSKTTRQFKNINNGNPYLYTYDATHNFSIVANYKIKESITLSAIWTYMTGQAITMPNAYFEAPIFELGSSVNATPKVNYDKIVTSYEQKNNVRMAPYHRLDISLNFKKHKKNSDRILSVGIYNLYNRQNAAYYYIGSKEVVDEMGRPTGASKRVVYQRSLFPIIPFISYSWAW